jgi:hypothetical protein
MDHDKDMSIDMNVNRGYQMRHVVRDTALRMKGKSSSEKGIESKSKCQCKQSKWNVESVVQATIPSTPNIAP